MGHVAVAAGAGQGPASPGKKRLAHHALMATQAVLLHDPAVPGDDAQDLDVTEGEGRGVAEPLVGLGQPLPGRIVGQVAVVADLPVVRPGAPAPVVIPHDVAVGAVDRVREEVGVPLGIPEGEAPDPDEDPGRHGQGQGQEGGHAGEETAHFFGTFIIAL